MNLLPRWMLNAAAPAHSEAPEPDPCDMGTAFGLDASMVAPEHADPAPDTHTLDHELWRQRLERRPQR